MTTQNQNIKKILIAPDKFKGSLTSSQAAWAIRRGLEGYFAGAGHDSGAGCAHSGADGSILWGFCAREEDFCGAGHDSGAGCAQGGVDGHEMAEICSPTAVCGGSGNDSGDICSPAAVCGGSGNVSGSICSPAAGCGGSGNVSGKICSPVEVCGGSGNDLGGICSPAEGCGCSGNVSGKICSPAEGCGCSGNVSGGICSPTEGCGGSGNVSGEICSPAAGCGSSGNVSGNGGVQFRMVEIADGGDGSLEVVEKRVANGRRVQCEAADPVGVRRPVEYLMYGQGGKVSAFVEMAKVCGLAQLDAGLRNPLNTSTYGLGEVILDAASRGAVSITLSIGGSATDDCGAGMLQALGFLFTDAAGNLLPVPVCGRDLERIVGIKEPEIKRWGSVEVICDVINPLLGPNGATAVYAPQKGADSDALVQLEEGKRSFTSVAEKCLGISQSCKEYPGAGAAGGVGYAGMAFLGAQLLPGWRFFARITSLEESVQWADLVITGEGSLDSQSLSGKVVSGVITLAHEYRKPVMIFCGVNKLGREEMDRLSGQLQGEVEVRSIASLGYPLEVCMRDAAALLERLCLCQNSVGSSSNL